MTNVIVDDGSANDGSANDGSADDGSADDNEKSDPGIGRGLGRRLLEERVLGRMPVSKTSSAVWHGMVLYCRNYDIGGSKLMVV